MSRPVDLPFASVRYTVEKMGGPARCEVVIGGEPVALLACSGLEYFHEHRDRCPRVKLLLLSETVDVKTYRPPLRAA